MKSYLYVFIAGMALFHTVEVLPIPLLKGVLAVSLLSNKPVRDVAMAAVKAAGAATWDKMRDFLRAKLTIASAGIEALIRQNLHPKRANFLFGGFAKLKQLAPSIPTGGLVVVKKKAQSGTLPHNGIDEKSVIFLPSLGGLLSKLSEVRQSYSKDTAVIEPGGVNGGDKNTTDFHQTGSDRLRDAKLIVGGALVGGTLVGVGFELGTRRSGANKPSEESKPEGVVIA